MRSFLIATMFLAACGGKANIDETIGDASTTDSATGSDTAVATSDAIPKAETGAPDYCKAGADRAARCDSGSFDALNCEKQVACIRTIARPGEAEPLLTCIMTRECGVSDDKCVAQSAMKYITDPVVQKYVKTCNEKRTACGAPFSDDYCGYDYGIYSDDLRSKMQTCVERSCAEVKDCFQTVIAATGCK